MNEIVSNNPFPVAAGLLLFLVPDKLRTVKGIIALLVSIVTGYLAVLVYSNNFEAGTLGEAYKGIRIIPLRNRSP